MQKEKKTHRGQPGFEPGGPLNLLRNALPLSYNLATSNCVQRWPYLTLIIYLNYPSKYSFNSQLKSLNNLQTISLRILVQLVAT